MLKELIKFIKKNPLNLDPLLERSVNPPMAETLFTNKLEKNQLFKSLLFLKFSRSGSHHVLMELVRRYCPEGSHGQI
jgi:hypothetical protein